MKVTMIPISLPVGPVKKLYDRTSGLRAGKMAQGPTRQHSINPGFLQWVLQPQQGRGQFHLHLHLQAIRREMLDFLQICQEHRHHLPHLQRSMFTKYKIQILISIIRQFLEVTDPPILKKALWRVLLRRWSTTPTIYIQHLHHGGKYRRHLNKISHNIPQLLLHLLQAGRFRGNP